MFALGYAGFLIWSVGRARERAAEHAATGMLRSPLYWSGVGLIGILVALTLSEDYALTQGGTLKWTWLAALGATLVAIFFVRRALKWRYPI
ncbi:hypothetical protein JQ559_06760 [Bradyrhizobium viridifuturi]|nr:hypothetical protein [Bradyrhizobium viridifuturi]MCA3567617.1 hypothetical protein [Bradyrhizobium sp.]OYU60309.1 MAG: hypothetical protein CFE30_20965 [Bradyrhizobium sp. PARBB1]PSO29304.1 hypothetical protein C7G43_01720 [Bradyrhizobium sp. MOS004]QRI73205.1 hypothetical protein JQ507_06045 [Bradyrhizobium sp. PSBB068]